MKRIAEYPQAFDPEVPLLKMPFEELDLLAQELCADIVITNDPQANAELHDIRLIVTKNNWVGWRF